MLLPLPARFLPLNTSICAFDKITIGLARNYSSYLWNTNEVKKEITIEEPGLYTLLVKDANECTGKDSILVKLKQCMEGVYVPTAFSPKGDGKNDQFRPLVFGDIQQYHFTVFKRWGKKIFETKDANKGWNGNFKGAGDGSQVYTWTCLVQLRGKAKLLHKGTVTLVR
ncbi:gliding motility-associated C-terminal domain-containing protein [Cnuella takakiae]|uniref:Gliding motility-associated C-terminal domain-containing protein n=1 Tax=Cnuella takakiae TaxID=1302690 RepID=A0A1M4SUL9_9BACT|nr:gliding motility-associated C-terminal domain-containing protein [Cnuella takakiae]SHE35911.1 gliding motility-associated C-terminal domain-containing protein [Cnuella takakiae]